ncbi:PWWP domain containing protein [Trema orientale]|uniref:PWWP domain containing protein n=1 Tax=Trema orientale TaxID=63057 RepID=A0A2P5AC72_TREOI|nr:PWWP domain containing protein [Trema orientale]
MENPKTPETLEAENPDDKTPKEASGSSGLREMNENFSGLESIFDISIEESVKMVNDDLGVENVEVATQLVSVENGSEIESWVKGDEVEKGCLVMDCVDEEKEVKMECVGSQSFKENEAEMGLVQLQSDGNIVDLGGNVVEDVGVEEKDRGEGESEDEPFGSNGIPSSGTDSSKKVEVSSHGISLFVDFSGSPGRFMHKDIDVDNCSPLTEGKKNLIYGDEVQGKNIYNQDFNFFVGDIVWVQTKNQTWWPGKICNPVDAPKYAARSGKGEHLLVGYYGISHFSWCCPSQLRPFHENFEEMSGKNKARIFVGAVEKAVDEFGRHVKLEMTCSCALIRSQLSVADATFVEELVKTEHKPGGLGEFSVANFEPVMFLEHLKYLAKVVSLSRALDFTVTHNRLSAFYRFNGHTQLPMHLLAERKGAEEDKVSGRDRNVLQVIRRCNSAEEGFVLSGSRKRKMKKDSEVKFEAANDEEEDLTGLCKSPTTKETEVSIGDVVSGKEGMIEKGFDSRERKKSRYLSYPYINWKQKGSSAGMEDPQVVKVPPEASMGAGQNNVSPLNLKCSGDKFWKKWYRRFSGESNIPGGSELINITSAELLCELRSAAVDCLYPSGNKSFNPVGWFFSRFRTSVYHDESVDEICPKNIISQNEVNDAEACLSGNNAEENKGIFLADKSKPKRTKKKETSKHLQGENTVSSPDVVGSTGNSIQDVKESLNLSAKGESHSGMKPEPLSGLSDVNISIAPDGFSVKDALDMGSSLPYNKVKRRRKKKAGEVNMEYLQTKQTTGIPDLNGSSVASSFLVDDPQVMSRIVSESKLELLKKMEEGARLADPNANIAASFLGVHENNAKPGTLVVDLRVPSEAPAVQDFASNNGLRSGLLDKHGQMVGLLSEGKPVPKKRKRREKAAPQIIPDLNGTTIESNSVGKEFPVTNVLAPPMKPERKRRRRKGQVAFDHPRNVSFAGTNVSSNKAEINGEPIGTALLLTFGAGVPMPSREDMVSIFCKFGPLKESETQLKDPGSAQIVFVRSVDAREAFQSIEKNNPFGPNLTNYRLHNISAVSRISKPDQTPCATVASSAVEGSANPQAPGAVPLDFIRQNLQMMTSMLEKSGDNLSPEMRAKLEAEIKGLLNKVSSMAG